MYRSGSGFTVVQLLLVIGLLSILAAAALPGFVPAQDAPRTVAALAQASVPLPADEAGADRCSTSAVAPAGAPAESPAPRAH